MVIDRSPPDAKTPSTKERTNVGLPTDTSVFFASDFRPRYAALPVRGAGHHERGTANESRSASHHASPQTDNPKHRHNGDEHGPNS